MGTAQRLCGEVLAFASPSHDLLPLPADLQDRSTHRLESIQMLRQCDKLEGVDALLLVWS